MGKAELEKELKNWLTVKQLLQYVKKRYGRHWTRQRLFEIQSDHYVQNKKRYPKQPYKFETVKIGIIRLYSKRSVDELLKNLKKPVDRRDTNDQPEG